MRLLCIHGYYDGEKKKLLFLCCFLQFQYSYTLVYNSPPAGASFTKIAPLVPTNQKSLDVRFQASPTDMAHCKDEGVLKQGYLFKRYVTAGVVAS